MPRPRVIEIPWHLAPSECRGCGATIWFVDDARTRRPHPVSVDGPGCRAPERETVARDPDTGVEHVVRPHRDGRGISHFETCPAADRFRG
jgi:hypothetical protein